jgi:hypothetical protein
LRIFEAGFACFEAKFASIIPEYTHISTIFRLYMSGSKNYMQAAGGAANFAFAVIVCYCHILLLSSKGQVEWGVPRRAIPGNFYQQCH